MVVLSIAGVVVWRIAIADFSRLTLSYTDFAGLVLALFSIGLSLAFYFKATETSNTFYDNTYRFTKDVSEILGRIESGFGERLRHLDEGYSDLRESKSKPLVNVEAETNEIKLERQAAKKIEGEQQALLRQLADGAKLQETEREAFFSDLSEKEKEIRSARREVRILKDRLEVARGARGASPASDIHSLQMQVSRFATNRSTLELLKLNSTERSINSIKHAFTRHGSKAPPQFIKDLETLGFANSQGLLTERGALWLRSLLISMRGSNPKFDAGGS